MVSLQFASVLIFLMLSFKIIKQFSEVVAELSPGRTCEKQVVQLGDLPPSCSSPACKHNSGTEKWECVLYIGVQCIKHLVSPTIGTYSLTLQKQLI